MRWILAIATVLAFSPINSMVQTESIQSRELTQVQVYSPTTQTTGVEGGSAQMQDGSLAHSQDMATPSFQQTQAIAPSSHLITLCPVVMQKARQVQQKDFLDPLKNKAVELFIILRNLLFAISAFALVGLAIFAIFKGEIDWKWIGTIIFILILLSLASSVIQFFTNTDALGDIDTLKQEYADRALYRYGGSFYYECYNGVLRLPRDQLTLESAGASVTTTTQTQSSGSAYPSL